MTNSLKKRHLIICAIVLFLLVQFWVVFNRNMEAKKRNDQQVSELLSSAIQLELPVNIEKERIEICHISAGNNSWNTYVFMIVKTRLMYQELAAQFEKYPTYLSHETTPIQVLSFNTYAAHYPYNINPNLENELRNSDDLFVLACFSPVADNFDSNLTSEDAPIVWRAQDSG